MKFLQILGLFLLTSCGNHSAEPATEFKRLLPDTANSWSGRMTRDDFYLTRKLEKKLHLETLSNGVKNYELRVWNLSGSYDPQTLLILRKSNAGQWNVRALSFYRTKSDSIYADNTRLIRPASIDILKLDSYWSVASQSDLKAGDTYGCVDGENVFVEIADSTKYRFMWYRCPDINKNKDSVFFLVSELANKLGGLTVEH